MEQYQPTIADVRIVMENRFLTPLSDNQAQNILDKHLAKDVISKAAKNGINDDFRRGFACESIELQIEAKWEIIFQEMSEIA